MRLRPCAAVRAPAAANTTPRHSRCCSKRAPDTHAAACDRAGPCAAPTAVRRNVASPDCITATMPLAEDSQARKERGAPSYRGAPPLLEPRHRRGSCPPPQKSAVEKAGQRAGTAYRRRRRRRPSARPCACLSAEVSEVLHGRRAGLAPHRPTSLANCACCISAMFSVLAAASSPPPPSPPPPTMPPLHPARNRPLLDAEDAVEGVGSGLLSLARRARSCPAPKECGVVLGAALMPCAKGVWRLLGAALVPCAKGSVASSLARPWRPAPKENGVVLGAALVPYD